MSSDLPLLIGYDPFTDLPDDHLARLVEDVVEMFVAPPPKALRPGQPERDPRVLLKVILYSCLTGVHSSRRMAQNCHENLAYLLLVRDDRPCHTALADARRSEGKTLRQLFSRLKEMAKQLGIPFLGRISMDSSKFSAIASHDSIVGRNDYDAVIATFETILALVEEADALEDLEGSPVKTSTGASRDQMREVLRSVGKGREKDLELSPRMVKRVRKSLEAVKAAKKADVSHVSTTDPDSRMMLIGADKTLGMGYQFEAVTDGGNLIVGRTGNHAGDGGRLLPLFELAQEVDPVPIVQVTADSGYFSTSQVLQLENSGVDVVVPDSTTVRELRFGPSAPESAPIQFVKVEGRNAYRCPEGNILMPSGHKNKSGQLFARYIASRECTNCPLAQQCLRQEKTKRRNIYVGELKEVIEEYLKKFKDPEVRKVYNSRGPTIETVFAIIHSIFGFHRWHVIGNESIASEGALLSCAYQLKKIQTQLRRMGKSLHEALA